MAAEAAGRSPVQRTPGPVAVRPKSLPFPVQEVATLTNFVHVRVCFDTAALPKELRPYLVLWQEALLETDLSRPGQVTTEPKARSHRRARTIDAADANGNFVVRRVEASGGEGGRSRPPITGTLYGASTKIRSCLSVRWALATRRFRVHTCRTSFTCMARPSQPSSPHCATGCSRWWVRALCPRHGGDFTRTSTAPTRCFVSPVRVANRAEGRPRRDGGKRFCVPSS